MLRLLGIWIIISLELKYGRAENTICITTFFVAILYLLFSECLRSETLYKILYATQKTWTHMFWLVQKDNLYVLKSAVLKWHLNQTFINIQLLRLEPSDQYFLQKMVKYVFFYPRGQFCFFMVHRSFKTRLHTSVDKTAFNLLQHTTISFLKLDVKI